MSLNKEIFKIDGLNKVVENFAIKYSLATLSIISRRLKNREAFKHLNKKEEFESFIDDLTEVIEIFKILKDKIDYPQNAK